MTQMHASVDSRPNGVPVWDVADRMRKSLRVANVSVQELADYLDVSRSTVSNWINGRLRPSVQSMRLVALRTGVSYEWLKDGKAKEPAGPEGPDGEMCAARDSNPQPADRTRARRRERRRRDARATDGDFGRTLRGLPNRTNGTHGCSPDVAA